MGVGFIIVSFTRWRSGRQHSRRSWRPLPALAWGHRPPWRRVGARRTVTQSLWAMLLLLLLLLLLTRHRPVPRDSLSQRPVPFPIISITTLPLQPQVATTAAATRSRTRATTVGGGRTCLRSRGSVWLWRRLGVPVNFLGYHWVGGLIEPWAGRVVLLDSAPKSIGDAGIKFIFKVWCDHGVVVLCCVACGGRRACACVLVVCGEGCSLFVFVFLWCRRSRPG